jgi:hypothetical protein
VFGCNSGGLDHVSVVMLRFPDRNHFLFNLKDTFMRTLSVLAALAFALSLTAAAQVPAPDQAAQSAQPAPQAARPPIMPATPPAPTVVSPALTGPVTYTCSDAKKGAVALTPSSLISGTSAG